MQISLNHHLNHAVDAMNGAQERLYDFMDRCDPSDVASWERIHDMTMELAGANFAAQNEFRLEHFLAKSLITSI